MIIHEFKRGRYHGEVVKARGFYYAVFKKDGIVELNEGPFTRLIAAYEILEEEFGGLD